MADWCRPADQAQHQRGTDRPPPDQEAGVPTARILRDALEHRRLDAIERARHRHRRQPGQSFIDRILHRLLPLHPDIRTAARDPA
jgi:hypothetical protein